MSSITPTVGRIVLFRLAAHHVDRIDRMQNQRLAQSLNNSERGNRVQVGDVFPMIITRVWGPGPDAAINGTLFIDGPDTVWITSAHCGPCDGDYFWMPYQIGQAGKTEKLQAELDQKFPSRAGGDPLCFLAADMSRSREYHIPTVGCPPLSEVA